MSSIDGERIWLSKGNYFLKVDQGERSLFYPVLMPLSQWSRQNGTFNVTIRPPVAEAPHGSLPDLPDYVFIPSGHFLFGDRLNPQEPHHVWLGSFFINPFEVTNAEFREFSADPHGYGEDTNWTEQAEAGKRIMLLKPPRC